MTLKLALSSAPLDMAVRYGKFAAAANTQPAYGLLCLAAVAERMGVAVSLYEPSALNFGIERTASAILADRPHLVGLSATTLGIVACGELARRLKAHDPALRILVGGCHATALAEDTLRRFAAFDMVVAGEGESSLGEILSHYQQHRELPAHVGGTIVRTANGIQRNPPAKRIADLDQLPLPAWHLLTDFPHRYSPTPGRIKQWPCASVVFSRGCPNVCLFCDRSVFGSRCRAHSPEYALRVVKDLCTNYGVREIVIEDDTFMLSTRRATRFCELLISANLGVTWSCLGRADRVTPELLKLMRRAGCWQIAFGIESGDERILKLMRKNLTLDQIRTALTWTREAGLKSKGFFMMGFPTETDRSLALTRRAALSLPLDDISVMQVTPFPGSALYDMAGRYGRFDPDWTRMNTLNTVFVPYGLSRSGLEIARGRMVRQFYLRPRILMAKALELLRRPVSALDMLKGLAALLRA